MNEKAKIVELDRSAAATGMLHAGTTSDPTRRDTASSVRTHLCQILARLRCISSTRAGGIAFRISGTCGATLIRVSLRSQTLCTIMPAAIMPGRELIHDNHRQLGTACNAASQVPM